jgi:hypothetical protein
MSTNVQNQQSRKLLNQICPAFNKSANRWTEMNKCDLITEYRFIIQTAVTWLKQWRKYIQEEKHFL